MTRKIMLTAVLLAAAFVAWGINYLYTESALPLAHDLEVHGGN